MMPGPCPVCGSSDFDTLLNPAEVRHEAALRSRFVQERLEKMPSAAELKDLTEFAHDAPASVVCCRGCGLLKRDEQADPSGTYVEDPYDFAAIEGILPRYLEAFRAKEEPYREMLPPGSRVLEIGPHFGAFLDVAAEWGWTAEGVDIGKDTSAYLMARGFRIHTSPVEECKFEGGSYDGVFIWNCFDQIEDPGATLAECRRITRERGVLVLRVPNARFYAACETFLRSGNGAGLADSVVAALGYDNLLAFPYLYGYDSGTLQRLASGHGYRKEAAIDTELIILPFPELPSWMVAERRAIAAAIRNLPALRKAEAGGYLTGPWIEMAFRAV